MPKPVFAEMQAPACVIWLAVIQRAVIIDKKNYNLFGIACAVYSLTQGYLRSLCYLNQFAHIMEKTMISAMLVAATYRRMM